MYLQVSKEKALPQWFTGEWTHPMEQESPNDRLNETHWRKIERIILHKDFKNEAQSWHGFDIALIKLQSKNGQNVPLGKIVPACLAIGEFEDKHNGSLFMAGYGRRRIPHCLTNDVGPEKYEVCGRQKECSKNHKTESCKLEFLDETGLSCTFNFKAGPLFVV